MSTPSQSYATIKQGPKEPYMQFIELMQDAMEKQIATNDAKVQLILQLAIDNSNDDCRKKY